MFIFDRNEPQQPSDIRATDLLTACAISARNMRNVATYSPNTGCRMLSDDKTIERLDARVAAFVPAAQRVGPTLSAYKMHAQADVDKFMRKKEETIVPKDHLLPIYHEFAYCFSKQDAKELPPHRPSIDHEIKLKPGTTPPFSRPYRMSNQEDEVIAHWVQEQLAQKGIRRYEGRADASSPVLIVKKPGGGLRVCIDYRQVNERTIKSRYPIPLMQDTLNRIASKKYFTKLDVIAAFNRIRIAEGSEWLTAFTTRYGQFECLVMPFGLCNAPGTFQSYINDTLREFLDDFASAYLDDILIFSDTLKEHIEHVKKVLRKCGEAGLQLDITKCEFHTQSTK